MMQFFTKQIRIYVERFVEFAKMHLLALKHSYELKLVQNNLNNIKKNDILLFSTMKNETFRLPYFLDYYRKLGVDHFIFVDNDSNDGMMEMLKDQKDITVYYTNKSYRDSHFGVYWLNHLLSKHGSNHWCLTCDPDEFLVFPHMESRNLNNLINYLDSQKINSFYAPLIDMYSKKPIDETYYEKGEDPLKICLFFDRTGYTKSYSKKYRYSGLIGGVRQRVFNSDNPKKAPALHKTPLIKWRKYYAYINSTHYAIPRKLNQNNHKSNNLTGALLHFKFINHLVEKVTTELEAKQHWDNSYEYVQYSKVINANGSLYSKDISIKYESWQTLRDLGLIKQGKW